MDYQAINNEIVKVLVDECSPLRLQTIRLLLRILWGILVLSLILVLISPFLIMFFVYGDTIFSFAYILFSGIILLVIGQHFRKIGESTIELIKKHSNSNEKREHHLIIIAYRDKNDQKSSPKPLDYLDGIDLLINYFNNRQPQIPFEIVEVHTKEKAISEIKNENAQFLWIFGHGQRNGLSLQDGYLCYKEIPFQIRKKFVGQYHCNSPWGTSLADVSHAEESDISNFTRVNVFTRSTIRKKLKELEQKNII